MDRMSRADAETSDAEMWWEVPVAPAKSTELPAKRRSVAVAASVWAWENADREATRLPETRERAATMLAFAVANQRRAVAAAEALERAAAGAAQQARAVAKLRSRQPRREQSCQESANEVAAAEFKAKHAEEKAEAARAAAAAASQQADLARLREMNASGELSSRLPFLKATIRNILSDVEAEEEYKARNQRWRADLAGIAVCSQRPGDVCIDADAHNSGTREEASARAPPREDIYCGRAAIGRRGQTGCCWKRAKQNVKFSARCALVKTWRHDQPTPGAGRLHFEFARGDVSNFESFDLQLDSTSGRVRFSQKALRGSAQHRIEIRMEGGSCIWLYLPEDAAIHICKFLAKPGIPIEVQSGLSPRLYTSGALHVQLGFSTAAAGRQAGYAPQQHGPTFVSPQNSKAPGALPIKRKPVIPTFAHHPIFDHPKYAVPELSIGRVSPSSSSSISLSIGTESEEATPRTPGTSRSQCAPAETDKHDERAQLPTGLPPVSVGAGAGSLAREMSYSSFGILRPELDQAAVPIRFGERRPRPLVRPLQPVRNVVNILSTSQLVHAPRIFRRKDASRDRLGEGRRVSIEASVAEKQIASMQSFVSCSIPDLQCDEDSSSSD